MTMLVLSRADVRNLLTMREALNAAENAFLQLAAGHVQMPLRVATPVEPHHGLHLSMPAYVSGEADTLAVKLVTDYPDNPSAGLPAIQGLVLLHNPHTGRPLALMDAEQLTAIRTGAASGLATRLLAQPGASLVTLFGAGGQAAAQLEAVCAVRPIQQALVVTRTGRQDAEFCLRMENRLGVRVLPCRDVRAAVEAADIICTATSSATPLFNGNWLGDGAHINAIGSHRPGARELDTTTVCRARVFVDHHPAAQAEAGDLLIPIANGDYEYGRVAGDLGSLAAGQVAGRTASADVTLFKSVGLAVQDAVTAALVYTLAVAQGVGRRIQL